ASELAVRDEVDPRGDLPPVFDQGQLGSCTANAVAGAVEYDAKLNGTDPGALSRLWIYYYERKIEGSPADQDTGAYGRDGFKVCKTVGVRLGAEGLFPHALVLHPGRQPRERLPHDPEGRRQLTEGHAHRRRANPIATTLSRPVVEGSERRLRRRRDHRRRPRTRLRVRPRR